MPGFAHLNSDLLQWKRSFAKFTPVNKAVNGSGEFHFTRSPVLKKILEWETPAVMEMEIGEVPMEVLANLRPSNGCFLEEEL
jgi:hypothetical protein